LLVSKIIKIKIFIIISKKHEQLLALMLEKNKYQSFNNLGNEAEINLYFDLTFKAYALPKLKTTYSNISSLKFFIQKNKE
jgi:hypothetical protein